MSFLLRLSNFFLLSVLLTACEAMQNSVKHNKYPSSEKSIPVLIVDRVLQDGWRHLPVKGTTDYRITHLDGSLVIKASGRGSASGLIRRLDLNTGKCPILSWTWRVDDLQNDANLRYRKTDDVAAAILVLFGDPGFLSDPDPVPTLRYVWTNHKHRPNDIIDNPYMPNMVKNIVVRTGGSNNHWRSEKRNVLVDFRRAFGKAAENDVYAVALFTDNDQTRNKVTAYYKEARFLCRG